MQIKIAPSLLSANFSCLKDEIQRMEEAGADLLHLDVMDGHFVKNITFGPVVIKDIRKVTKLPFDVHLMIENPEDYADSFVKAGADMITFHIETISVPKFQLISSELRSKGIKVGISLNPLTPLERITGVLNDVDFVLIMSVTPGFGGQEFIPSSLQKIKQLREIFKKDISVDGGINDITAEKAILVGANILVSGSYVFKSENCKDTITRLRGKSNI